MRGLVRLLLLTLSITALPAVEILTWDALVTRFRERSISKGALVYLGSAENRLPHMIRQGQIELHGLQPAIIDAEQATLNPISDRPIRGLELFRLLGGNAGTVVFLDRDGVPLVQLSLPQIYHGNDAELLDLFAGYAAGGHHAAMSVVEYSRAMGMEEVERRANVRMQTNGFGVPLMPSDEVPTAIMPGGEPITLRQNPGVFFVIGLPDHQAFRQQLMEIALAFRAYEPRIVAVVPHGTDIDKQVRETVGGLVVANAAQGLFEREATPRMMLFGEDGSGMTFYGFQPADVISKHTRVEIGNIVSRVPNMPYGETDTGQLPVVSQQEMLQRVNQAEAHLKGQR